MRNVLYFLLIITILSISCSKSEYQKSYTAATLGTIDILRTALNEYYNDTGNYPPGNAENDEGNINMILALSDKSEEEGGLGGPFYPYMEFRDAELRDSEFSPSHKVLIDPWQIPYRYVRATDSNGKIKPGMQDKTPYAIWSCGPNRKDDSGTGDDITSWSEYEFREDDDVSASQVCVIIITFIIILFIVFNCKTID